MSKIHPHHVPTSPILSSLSTSSSSSSSSSSFSTLNCNTREVFTIWMKSLILGGKGCTVFDSNGCVVYRVDNYSSRYCDKVFLMDSHGHVLLTILKKKFRLLANWEGYREERKNKGASWWFQVQKSWKITKKPLQCMVKVNPNHENQLSTLKIEKGKSELSSCRIVDRFGHLLAEVKRKQSLEGVILGNDVLTMVVEPNTDHYLIMGLLVAYSLIESIM